MHPSIERFLHLGARERREALLRLVEEPLRIWQDHVAAHGPLEYEDEVVGLSHTVDGDLPARALRVVRGAASDAAAVERAYAEPLTALQDGDLELPDAVRYAYDAILNLFLVHGLGGDGDEMVIVNQAIAAVGGADAADRVLADWP